MDQGHPGPGKMPETHSRGGERCYADGQGVPKVPRAGAWGLRSCVRHSGYLELGGDPFSMEGASKRSWGT